jgi:hypothetical protein
MSHSVRGRASCGPDGMFEHCLSTASATGRYASLAIMAGTAENKCQLTGILKTDDGFRAPNSRNWTAHLDPVQT